MPVTTVRVVNDIHGANLRSEPDCNAHTQDNAEKKGRTDKRFNIQSQQDSKSVPLNRETGALELCYRWLGKSLRTCGRSVLHATLSCKVQHLHFKQTLKHSLVEH